MDTDRELLKVLLSRMHQHNKLDAKSLLNIFSEVNSDISIPVSIFKSTLSSMETLVYYLRKHKKFSNTNVASLLNRSEQTIWQAYKRSSAKQNKLLLTKSKFVIPLSLFSHSQSIMTTLILHLKTIYNLSNKEIAQELGTTPNSIAVIAKRTSALNKKKKKKKK